MQQNFPDEKCLFKYSSQSWDGYQADSVFSKNYRFEFNRRTGRPNIQYIRFKSAAFEMSCGSNDCPIINRTTTTPGPTTTRNITTTPLVTSPPLAGNSCIPYVEVTGQSAGQKFGVIRITTTKALSEFNIAC